MNVKVYKMLYKLAITYLAVGIFTYSCAHTIRQNENRKKEESIRNCVIHFASNVDNCLNPFLTILKRQRVRQKSKATKLVQTFSQKTFCLHYEETLQCLHETLSSCDTTETSRYVQERLSAPWVLRTNKVCNINIKQEKLQSNKNSTNNKENTSNKTNAEFTKELYSNQRIKGDNEEIDTSSDFTDKPENTSDDSALKFRPRETFIQRQTNINVYVNPTEIKSENVFIKDLSASEMSITFGQKDGQVKKHTWKTKIGELLFQQKKPL